MCWSKLQVGALGIHHGGTPVTGSRTCTTGGQWQVHNVQACTRGAHLLPLSCGLWRPVRNTDRLISAPLKAHRTASCAGRCQLVVGSLGAWNGRTRASESIQKPVVKRAEARSIAPDLAAGIHDVWTWQMSRSNAGRSKAQRSHMMHVMALTHSELSMPNMMTDRDDQRNVAKLAMRGTGIRVLANWKYKLCGTRCDVPHTHTYWYRYVHVRVRVYNA